MIIDACPFPLAFVNQFLELLFCGHTPVFTPQHCGSVIRWLQDGQFALIIMALFGFQIIVLNKFSSGHGLTPCKIFTGRLGRIFCCSYVEGGPVYAKAKVYKLMIFKNVEVPGGVRNAVVVLWPYDI